MVGRRRNDTNQPEAGSSTSNFFENHSDATPQKGIKGRRINTIGYGGSKPLKIPKKGEFHAPNRRVVFKIGGLN